MKVRLILVPFHLGHERRGMGLGPVRWLEAGAEGELARAGHVVRVHELLSDGETADEIGTVFELNRRLARTVREATEAGELPLVMAGNCSSSLGVLAGLTSPSIGVVWFDAHGDFNTPETTRSGFFDGMALAVATGRCWRELASTVPGFAPVAEERVLLVAARDLDPAERDLLERSRVRRVAPARGEDGGLVPALEEALEGLRRETGEVYLHVDLDALDPSEGPANSYAAPGGMGLEELEAAIGAIRRRFAVRAAALTAYDPAADPSGRACRAGLRIARALAGGSP